MAPTRGWLYGVYRSSRGVLYYVIQGASREWWCKKIDEFLSTRGESVEVWKSLRSIHQINNNCRRVRERNAIRGAEIATIEEKSLASARQSNFYDLPIYYCIAPSRRGEQDGHLIIIAIIVLGVVFKTWNDNYYFPDIKRKCTTLLMYV